jgi:phospholipase C
VKFFDDVNRMTTINLNLVSPLRWLSFATLALVLSACVTSPARVETAPASPSLERIQHLVVIYAENHSFDNLYGLFPGAEGIASASVEQKTQLDHDGKPLRELVVFDHHGHPDARFPRMPNGPFRIDAAPVNRRHDELVPSPIHAFWHNQEQIHGGRNNMFAAMSNVGGWSMGYYDGSSLKLWQWAKAYTLADHFFMGTFGGSYLNHQYLICACIPKHESAPASMRVALDADGKLTKQADSGSAAMAAVKVISHGGGQVTPDGWSVNTTQPPYQPSGIAPAPGGSLDLADPKGTSSRGEPLPPQTSRTVADTLSAKGVSWAWYSGGWNAALADGRRPSSEKRSVIYTGGPASPNFQPHHQPFNYHARFAPGTTDRAQHLKDGDALLKDAAAGQLPAVSFYKPAGRWTQHPSYTDVKSGDEHMASVLEALRRSPQWKDMLIVVTYDENGGYWDHMPPPTGPGWGDRWGPGTRVPTLLIGPHVKQGHVDKTPYDTGSILKFITRRWGLEPLPGVRTQVGDLSAALQ